MLWLKKMRLWRPKHSFDLFLFYAFALRIYILPCMTQNDSVSHFHFIYPQYCIYSGTFHMVKMESVSKIAILGQKMMTKSGLDFDRNNMKNLRKNRDKVWYINAFLVKGFAYICICSKTNLKSIIFKANLWLIHSSFKSEDPTFLELDLCPRRSC